VGRGDRDGAKFGAVVVAAVVVAATLVVAVVAVEVGFVAYVAVDGIVKVGDGVGVVCCVVVCCVVVGIIFVGIAVVVV